MLKMRRRIVAEEAYRRATVLDVGEYQGGVAQTVADFKHGIITGGS